MASAQEGAWSLDGLALDRDTRLPLAGATVSLLTGSDGRTSFSVVTDSSGAFHLEGTTAAKLNLAVEDESHSQYQYGADTNSGLGTLLDLVPGTTLPRVVLYVPSNTLRGHVYLRDSGQALEGCQVSLLSKRLTHGMFTELEAASSSSDVNGAFLFKGFSVGPYKLLFRCSDATTGKQMMFYYPNATSIKEASIIDLRGSENDVDIPTQWPTDFGAVAELIRGVGADVSVSAALYPDDTASIGRRSGFPCLAPSSQVLTCTSVPSGHYVLVLSQVDMEGVQYATTHLAVTAGITTSGSINIADRSFAVHILKAESASYSPWEGTLLLVPKMAPWLAKPITCKRDMCQFQAKAGEYTLSLRNGDGSTYIKNFSVNGRELWQGEYVTFDDKLAAPRMLLFLGLDGATVIGRPLQSTSGGSRFISIASRSSSIAAPVMRIQAVGSDGSFRFSALPPGDYELRVGPTSNIIDNVLEGSHVADTISLHPNEVYTVSDGDDR